MRVASGSKVTADEVRSLRLLASEACERPDRLQTDAGIRPEPSVPPEPGHGSSSDEYRVEPELTAVVQPDVSIAEQAANDRAGINGEGGY